MSLYLINSIINQIQELRDVLYVFKRSKTSAFVDSDDDPSSWPITYPDNALGCPVHGIATVLDSGSASTDYLIVATYQGIMLFTGRYLDPELSWKVDDLWGNQDSNEFSKIQMVNLPIKSELYCVLTDGRILVGNYSKGLNQKVIRWAPWRFNINVTCIAVVNIEDVIIGADTNA